MGKQSPGVNSLVNYLSSSEISLQAHPMKADKLHTLKHISKTEKATQENIFILTYLPV